MIYWPWLIPLAVVAFFAGALWMAEGDEPDRNETNDVHDFRDN